MGSCWLDGSYCRGQTAGLTVHKQRLDEFSMVFYNNLLSLPFLGALVVAHGEVRFFAIFYELVLDRSSLQCSRLFENCGWCKHSNTRHTPFGTEILRSVVFSEVLVGAQASTVLYEPALQDPLFLTAACASALLAFGISFASLWFLSTTTPTTYSLVGSLNKVPVAVIGLLAFSVAWSAPNLASIAVGLVAGVVFAQAKQFSTK